MRRFDDPGAFARFLGELPPRVVAAQAAGLEAAGVIIETEAKDEIGHYQAEAGPFEAWSELATSTKRDRVRKGFPENEPLLRTGELRLSIGHTVFPAKVEIGSNDEIAVYQEHGTARIPPRSFLGGAAVRKGKEAVEAVVGPVVAVLRGDTASRLAIAAPREGANPNAD